MKIVSVLTGLAVYLLLAHIVVGYTLSQSRSNIRKLMKNPLFPEDHPHLATIEAALFILKEMTSESSDYILQLKESAQSELQSVIHKMNDTNSQHIAELRYMKDLLEEINSRLPTNNNSTMAVITFFSAPNQEGDHWATVIYGSQCSNMVLFNDVASSYLVNTENSCLIIYEHYDCQGRSIRVQSAVPTAGNMNDLDKLTSSVANC